jgi:hypothetical protein
VTAAAPAPPPLDDGLDQLMRRMRLPRMRRTAPEVIATAKAQRRDPAEVPRAARRQDAGAWDEKLSSAPAPAQAALRTLTRKSGPVRQAAAAGGGAVG